MPHDVAVPRRTVRYHSLNKPPLAPARKKIEPSKSENKTFLHQLREGEFFVPVEKGFRSTSNLYLLRKIKAGNKKKTRYLVSMICLSRGRAELHKMSAKFFDGSERVQLILKESMNERSL